MTKWVQQRVPRTARAAPLALWGGEVEGSSCSILQQGWLWGHLAAAPPVPAGRVIKETEPGPSQLCLGRRRWITGINWDKRYTECIWEAMFPARKTAQQWDRQPREALQSASLETQQNIALHNHVCSDLGPQRELCCDQELDKRILHKK